MRYVCDSCRKAQKGEPYRTATGRKLCDACRDQFQGAALGMAAGKGVGEAISIGGWLSRVRTARRRT